MAQQFPPQQFKTRLALLVFLKGASAQAVQCYNIQQNIDEKTGLI